MLKFLIDGYWKLFTCEFGGGGGGAPANTTSTSTAEPWSGQQPYLSEVMRLAQQNYNSSTPTYFPGQVTASADPLTGVAQEQLLQGGGQGNELAQTAAASNAFNMTAGRDVRTNPYLQSAIDAAVRPLTRQFTETGGDLSQGRDAATAAGQFGGSRHGIAEGIATRGYLDKVGDVASTMASRGYEMGATAANQASALVPQTNQALLGQAQTSDAVAQQRTAYTQAAIDDAIAKWNFEQNLPGAKLAQFQSLVQGNYGGQSAGTQTGTSGSRSSGIAGMLGGAAAGASLASAGVFGTGVSAGMGAGMGALLMLL